METYRLGTTITVKWRLVNNEGEPFSLSGYKFTLQYKTGRGINTASSIFYPIGEDGRLSNVLVWHFLGSEQQYAGDYDLVLTVRFGDKLICEQTYEKAFCLYSDKVKPRIKGSTLGTEEEATAVVELTSSAEWWVLADRDSYIENIKAQIIGNPDDPSSASTIYGAKKYAEEQCSTVYTPKGSVRSYDDLPTEGLSNGDVYSVLDNGKVYVWVVDDEEGNGHWDNLGLIVDLSDYATNEKVEGVEQTLNETTDNLRTLEGVVSALNSEYASLNKDVNAIKTELSGRLSDKTLDSRYVIKIGRGLVKDSTNTVSVKSASLSTDAVKVVIGDSGVKAEAQTASSTQAGVIRIGKRLSIDENGVLSADEQITEEEKKKLSAVKVIEADEQTIKSESLTSGAVKLFVGTIQQSQVEGLEEALAKKGGALKINDIEVPHNDDGTMHFELGKSLSYDNDSNALKVIWNE